MNKKFVMADEHEVHGTLFSHLFACFILYGCLRLPRSSSKLNPFAVPPGCPTCPIPGALCSYDQNRTVQNERDFYCLFFEVLELGTPRSRLSVLRSSLLSSYRICQVFVLLVTPSLHVSLQKSYFSVFT
ncbi:hypothetical protein K1719_015134 [Acacia pycnantha]|nr:hypothetical protein K1719_015134 [Acacia pycnantha]